MLTLQSPKFSNAKAEITKNSPTYRSKRAPSATDSYSGEYKQRTTAEFPAKLQADRKRKSNNQNSTSSLTIKHVSKEKQTKKIIDSIQQLKIEYKKLKKAYKQLFQQKLKNTNQITQIHKQNQGLKKENQRISRQNQKLKLQVNFLQLENKRFRRQFFKLLQVQKFKAQKLEQSLKEKQQYINQTILQIRTEADENSVYYPRHGSLINLPQEDVSLTISQDKSMAIDPSMNNQNQFLSFSLTSVLQESIDKELAQSKRKIQHIKAVSYLPYSNQEEERKPKHNFKKPKKEFIPKLELNKIGSKGNILRTDGTLKGVQKQNSKSRVSKSFREKQNKQTFSQNFKKKSKKCINLSGIAEV